MGNSFPRSRPTRSSREITWSELKKAGKLNDGKIQQGGPSMHHEPLKIENPTNQPKVVALIDLKDPGVTALSYGHPGLRPL